MMKNNDFSGMFEEMFGGFGNFGKNGYDGSNDEPEEYFADKADIFTQDMYKVIKGRSGLTLKPIRDSLRVAVCNEKNEILHTFENALMGKRFLIMMVIGEY